MCSKSEYFCWRQKTGLENYMYDDNAGQACHKEEYS
jgi:hypothetical protein